jgi:hypothetical protein
VRPGVCEVFSFGFFTRISGIARPVGRFVDRPSSDFGPAAGSIKARFAQNGKINTA